MDSAFVRQFAHPPRTRLVAITESDQLQFSMPCDIVGERRAGAEIKLPFWPAAVEKYELEETPLTGRIEVWDPPAVFQWTWSGDILRFELNPTDGGTRLTFTTWLEAPDFDGAAGAAGGSTYVWTSCEYSSTPAPYLRSTRAMQLPAASSRNTRSDSVSVESRPTPSDWPERAQDARMITVQP